MSTEAGPAREKDWFDSDRRVVPLLLLWIAAVFGLIWNGYWVPSGDSEIYLVMGRNLFQGKGLTFNGISVAFVAPGWPVILALLYHLTDSIFWLKGVLIVCMTAHLMLGYAILRHFASVRVAGLSTALAAILSPLYPLTFWLHSDALFCAVATTAGLLAVKLGDSRGRRWLVLLAAVVLLCVISVCVRWAAVPQMFVLSALAWGSGRGAEGESSLLRRRAAVRHWAGSLAVAGAILGTFFLLLALLSGERNDPDRSASAVPVGAQGKPGETSQARARVTGVAAPGAWLAQLPAPSLLVLSQDGPPQVVRQPITGDDDPDAIVLEENSPPQLLVGPDDPSDSFRQIVQRRVLQAPQWLSWTLFQPIRMTMLGGPGLVLDLGVGMLALAMLAVAAWRGARRRQLLWLGVVVYVLALAMNWPQVNNRYLVPVAPFVIGGILVGLGELIRSGRAWLARASRALRWTFLVAVCVCNVPVWAIDVLVFRSGNAEDFYAWYEAGIYQSLFDVGAYIADHVEPQDAPIACSLRYENLSRVWNYPFTTRTIAYLTNHETQPAPKLLTGTGVKKAQAWSRKNGVRYFVQQNPTMPGRIWHFRLSPQLHERITGWPPHPERPQFELYEMLPDPIPRNPDLRSLKYVPTPAVVGEELEQLSRRIPHLRRPSVSIPSGKQPDSVPSRKIP